MLKLEKLLAGTALAVVLAFSTVQNGLAGFEEAVTAYEAGEYNTAYEEWLPLAQSNDPAAMRNIGHLFRRGLGVDQDFEQALSWYKRAADMGFDRAQANVATMYLKGEGVKQDYEEASEWFSKAARNGHTIAQYNLGLMYEHGKGVKKSASKALGWYNLAAKAGHKQALDKLSILVARDPSVREEKPVTADKEAIIVSEVTQKPKKAPPVKKLEPVKQPAKQKPVLKPKTAAAPKKIIAPVASPEKPKSVVAPKVAAVKKPEPPKKVIVAPQVPKASVATVNKAPEKQKAVEEKWDPFAGSANNPELKGEAAPKGEATVFAKPKKKEAVQKAVTPPGAPVIVEKPEKVAAKKAAVKLSDVSENKAEPVKAEAKEAVKKEEKQEEKKGFFAALKSLIVGDKEETTSASPAKATASSSAPAKMATPTITKPVTPKAPVVVAAKPAIAPTAAPALPVTGGSGLTLSEQLEMADLAFTLEEYQQALNVWAPLAQKGNAEAQFNLGNMFLGGHAVPVDRVRAYYWWEKAKNNGSPKAAVSLDKLKKSLTFLEKRQLKRTN